MDWIELKAAAARLLYNDNRSAQDYNALIECVELCEKAVKTLEKAGTVIDEFGKELCDDPLIRPCTDCVKGHACGIEEQKGNSTDCNFRWTFADDINYILKKAKTQN